MNNVVIDVREPFEYEINHVSGAINIPLNKIETSKEIEAFPKDTPIIVYCASGNRSIIAMSLLLTKGYTNVINGINKDTVMSKFLSGPNY